MAQLPLQNFITAQTVVTAAWLNQVDALSHVMGADATGHVILFAPTATGLPALTINGTSAPSSTAGALVVNGASGPTPSQAMTINGGSNPDNVALAIKSNSKGEALLLFGNNVLDNSLGMTILAGTSANDACIGFGSASGSIGFGGVLGDGSFFIGGFGTTGLGPGTMKTTSFIQIASSVAPPAGGGITCGVRVSSTVNLGLYFGTGAPTFAAAQGSIYSNTSGGAGARLYVNTNGATTWVPATSP